MTAKKSPQSAEPAEPDATDAAEAPEPPPGLVCPRCGCRHMLYQDGLEAPVRHWRTTKIERRTGYIRRRRVCRHCGRVVFTRETVEKP